MSRRFAKTIKETRVPIWTLASNYDHPSANRPSKTRITYALLPSTVQSNVVHSRKCRVESRRCRSSFRALWSPTQRVARCNQNSVQVPFFFFKGKIRTNADHHQSEKTKIIHPLNKHNQRPCHDDARSNANANGQICLRPIIPFQKRLN